MTLCESRSPNELYHQEAPAVIPGARSKAADAVSELTPTSPSMGAPSAPTNRILASEDSG